MDEEAETPLLWASGHAEEWINSAVNQYLILIFLEPEDRQHHTPQPPSKYKKKKKNSKMGMHDEQKATDRTRQERYLPKGPHSLPANQATEAGRRQRAEHCVIADLTRPRSPRLHFAIHVALAWSPLEALGLLESLLSQRCPVLLTSHLLPAISWRRRAVCSGDQRYKTCMAAR